MSKPPCDTCTETTGCPIMAAVKANKEGGCSYRWPPEAPNKPSARYYELRKKAAD